MNIVYATRFGTLWLLYLEYIWLISPLETGFQLKWKQLLTGKIKAVAILFLLVECQSPPFLSVVKEKNGTLSFRGATADVIDWLASSLDVAYHFVPVSSSEETKHGMVQASINQLIRNEVDIVSTGIIPTPSRATEMDFSIPLLISQYRFMVPWPQEEGRYLAPIYPFQSMVWVWIFIALVSVAFALCIIWGFYQKWATNKPFKTTVHVTSLSAYATYVVSVLTNQGNYFHLRQTSLRIAAGMYCLMALVLINAYSGNLVCFLTVPKLKPIVSSFEDLASSLDLKVAVDAKSVLADRFLEASSGVEKTLGDSLRRDSQSLLTTRVTALKTMFSFKYAYVGVDPVICSIINASYDKRSSKCIFTASKYLSTFQFFCYGLPKGGHYNTLIDHKLQTAVEMGLINYWIKKHTPRIDQCLLNNHKRKSTTLHQLRSLQLYELFGAFAVLGLGLAISLLVFLLEQIMPQTVRHREFYRERSDGVVCNASFLAFTLSTKILFDSDGQK